MERILGASVLIPCLAKGLPKAVRCNTRWHMSSRLRSAAPMSLRKQKGKSRIALFSVTASFTQTRIRFHRHCRFMTIRAAVRTRSHVMGIYTPHAVVNATRPEAALSDLEPAACMKKRSSEHVRWG